MRQSVGATARHCFQLCFDRLQCSSYVTGFENMSRNKKYKDRNAIITAGYCRMESGDMNIIKGIILIIYQYQRLAKWSSVHKGENIKLVEDDSKAVSIADGHSVRADFGIHRGEIVSWELEFKILYASYNFVGVVSSLVTDFNTYPSGKMNHAYGVDDSTNSIYKGFGCEWSDWKKPKLPLRRPFVLGITADWTEKQCKLIYYYEGKKLNEINTEYTMLLPELNDNAVWYPCVTPFNHDAYCIIRYV